MADSGIGGWLRRTFGGAPKDAAPIQTDRTKAVLDQAAKRRGGTPQGAGSSPRPSPPPPEAEPSFTDDEVRAKISDSAREIVLLRRIFPPPFDGSVKSFLGGLPVAGPIKWPRSGEDNVPSSFLGQVELDELPQFADRHLLPASGRLLFFYDMNGLEGFELDPDAPVVIHDETPWSDARETAAPADLGPLYGQIADYYFTWIPRGEGFPSQYEKWPVEMKAVSWADPVLPRHPDDERERWMEIRAQERLREMERVFGPAPEQAEYRSSFKEVGRPSARFPESWMAADASAGRVMREIEDIRVRAGYARKAGKEPSTPAAQMASYDATYDEAAEWRRRARTIGLETAPADADRDGFWAWFEGLAQKTMDIHDLRNASRLTDYAWQGEQVSIDQLVTRSAQAASLVGPDARATSASRHSPVKTRTRRQTSESEPPVRDPSFTRHQMFGKGREVQSAVEAHEGSHHLLMQFDSDSGINWMWGDVGVLQYWITPDDLKAQRFDRVEVTMEGH